MHARNQYMADVRKEYPRAGQNRWSRLLDQAQKRTVARGQRRKIGKAALGQPNRPHHTGPATNSSAAATVARITGVRGSGDIDKGQPRVFQITVRLDW